MSEMNEKMTNQKNTSDPISNFTLRDLIRMTGGEQREGLLGECAAVTRENDLESFHHPTRMDAFTIGIGTKGETSLSYNLRDHTMRRDTLFIFTPKNVLQIKEHTTFEAHVLIFSPELMKELSIDTRHLMPLFLQFAAYPCLELKIEDSRTLHNYISLIEEELNDRTNEFAVNIIKGLVSVTLYKVGDVISHYLDEHPEAKNTIYSRAENYFRQFMELLNDNYKKQRSVGFYAQKLCITPKYLTILIKRISGKSVSQWVDNFVVMEAKMLLRYSKMSIQEIAYELNFPNQSFFGSYFKRNTGMSPSQYKATE